MNAALRSTADLTPIPVENGSPVQACVTTVGNDWRTAWMFDGGRHKELFGRAYSLRDALGLARALNERSGLA